MSDYERPRRERTSRARTSVRGADAASREALRAASVDAAAAAATLAARRAQTLSPAVPPAEVRSVDAEVTETDDGLDVTVAVTAYGREPVDSRALMAADLLATTLTADAGVGGSAVLGPTEVVEARGGEEGLSYDFDPPVRTAVLTVSDAVTEGDKEDRAGETVAKAVERAADHGVELEVRRTSSSDPEALEGELDRLAGEVDLVLTVGGTGLSHDDATVGVVERHLDREIPGLMEDVRDHGRSQTPLAFMSRGVAGLVGETLVVTLPGSSSGAAESVEALFPQLLHVFRARRTSRRQLSDNEEDT
ncbi:MAG: molybdopterin-binding protein [Bradymonadaceae bacterium]